MFNSYNLLYYSIRSNCRRIYYSLASHTLHAGPFLSHGLVEVTVPTEEASQEVIHAKIDATINTSGVMKRLGCESLEKRSPYVKTLSPHAEQCLRSPRTAPPHAEQCLRSPRSAPPHAEQGLRTPRMYLRMRSRVSARREGTSACGGSSSHAENVRPHAEMALRTRRMFARMRTQGH